MKIEEYGSIKDFINEVYLLPYLTIGGSRTDFWKLTPKDILIDIEAYRKRNENQLQMIWLQGFYFKQALQSSVLVCGLADKKVVREMPKYPDIPLTKDEQESAERRQAKNQLLIAKMNKWQRVNNARFKK